MVKILDCTTRDGGHETNWLFDKLFVKDLIKRLNNNKIDYYEIGYRNYKEKENKGEFFYCTPKMLKEYCQIKGNLKMGVMVDTSRFNENDFLDGKNDYVDFVRIATHPDRIKETLDIAHKLYKRNYKIFIQLMEIPNVKQEHYDILKNWEHKNILESLYIADSYSTAVPEDLEFFFKKLKSIGYDKISFHAHNKHGLALQNTLRAINLGAYSVDATLNAIGTNLNTDDLMENINKQNSKYYKELSYV